MDARLRHDRTVRQLEARLEALARASEHSLVGGRLFDREIVCTAAATRHAIDLELLSLAEADDIWAAVARRHPDVSWCEGGFEVLAAA